MGFLAGRKRGILLLSHDNAINSLEYDIICNKLGLSKLQITPTI
jgi:hypothetical protein